MLPRRRWVHASVSLAPAPRCSPIVGAAPRVSPAGARSRRHGVLSRPAALSNRESSSGLPARSTYQRRSHRALATRPRPGRLADPHDRTSGPRFDDDLLLVADVVSRSHARKALQEDDTMAPTVSPINMSGAETSFRRSARYRTSALGLGQALEENSSSLPLALCLELASQTRGGPTMASVASCAWMS